MNKFKLLTTVILFFVGSLSYAQKGLNFSVKGMPQASLMISKTDFDNPDHESNVYYGSAFGVGIGYNFTSKLGVSMDFLFSSEGNKYAYDTLNTKFEYIEQYKYFKIPLQIVFSGETSNTVCFRGKFGPYMGLFRKGDVEQWDGKGAAFFDEQNLTFRSASDVMEDEYQSFVFGLALNLGMAINITDQIAIDTGFRTDYGLTDARDRRLLPHDPDNDYPSNPLTVAWEFGVRYTLSD
ncbi:outer membrane beta-barrel protein [Salibacter halophilus]|uniref:PorT family protein n=1 Tax=Salibacter halophilus TaxID=1803916 RepID=A0A6N6MB25_9FLAO|nr:outer membrane beta-barrel protein [Salibacter halophilus]KAB1065631.1 PorT family protein [Salibacter halophilus]